MPLELVTIPALSDNYTYLLHDATSGATAPPMRVEPVALSSATPGLRASCSPSPAPPTATCSSFSGASPKRRAARENSARQASAVRRLGEKTNQCTEDGPELIGARSGGGKQARNGLVPVLEHL